MGPKGVFTMLFMAALSSSQLAKVASYPVSGASLSESMNGNTKTGECAYSDSLGKQIQISYTETASGEITITSGSGYSGDGKEDLRKCREAAEQAQKEAEKAVEEHMKSITDFDKNFKKQQEELEKTMKDLDAQVGGKGGVGRVGEGSERVLLVLALVLSTCLVQLVSL
ncbi:uncharacterized protein LOC125039865 [Penaeus chinensis]|uniref:uncharacterized protein LOC125039865 n=1 Tax=Penaeus chinensis TaxID=139456 RepID=UPI001FB5F455|nr:uncharacterized protein LOC125039865 [Penaeus chinensis]XP_047490143.1 uncharacterized protein LOC125039865 [Penaeus chinensis]